MLEMHVKLVAMVDRHFLAMVYAMTRTFSAALWFIDAKFREGERQYTWCSNFTAFQVNSAALYDNGAASQV